VQWYGGCLTVLHAVPTFDAIETHPGDWFDPITVVYPMRRDAVIERVGQMVVAAGIPHDRVRCEAEAGVAAPTIVGPALALRADTVVLGMHAGHDAERLLLGSTADAVLRRAPCDVLTVPPHCATAQKSISTILCGVDFSTRSRDALRAAVGLPDRFHARLVVVHAIEWLVEIESPDQLDFDVADLRTRLVYNGQQHTDAFVSEEAPADAVILTKIAIGRAYRELLAVAAAEHAQVIVVGNHGRGGAALPALGSTVEQLVRGAECPVLTIQSPHQRHLSGSADAPVRD